MSLYRDDGVVLRGWKLGEADRIVSVMTKRHGKVRAVAKGVRKTRSKFGSRLEAASHIAVQFYEGRGDLDIVTQVETRDVFASLRTDVDQFSRASAMLEAVDQMSPDREPNPALYTMLVRGLATLEERRSALVVAAFYWKLLALEGFEPVTDVCVSCAEDAALVAFDAHEGGLLCSACRRGRAVTPQAVELMRMILGGRLAAALEVDDVGLVHEVDHLATEAMEHHLERRIRSVGVMHSA